jgi:hypothetical protein
MMSNFAWAVLCATTFCAMVSIAPYGAQALPIGVKSPIPAQGAILVKRECIAWERGKCVRWAECRSTVC